MTHLQAPLSVGEEISAPARGQSEPCSSRTDLRKQSLFDDIPLQGWTSASRSGTDVGTAVLYRGRVLSASRLCQCGAQHKVTDFASEVGFLGHVQFCVDLAGPILCCNHRF